MFSLSPHALAQIWFALLAVLLTGYAILDGFDLGVGILHLFVPRAEQERRIFLNSIGPLWDGNEVWLVTYGGALFAAFPEAYASIFSGFYTAFMLVLMCLIGRAVSIEFRGKVASPGWRRVWDHVFGISSLGATLLFGVAVGNSMLGIPLNERHDFVGTFTGLINPYSILVGLLAVAIFAMHGAIYLYLKTEGDIQKRLEPLIWKTFALFLALFLLVTLYTLWAVPAATATLRAHPIFAIVPLLNALAIANIPRAIHRGKPGYAFLSSSATIAAFVFLLSVTVFPNLVTSSLNPARNSLTIYNAASSPKTLAIMLLIAMVGVPCVLSYTAVIYWTFRGKVKLDLHSY